MKVAAAVLSVALPAALLGVATVQSGMLTPVSTDLPVPTAGYAAQMLVPPPVPGEVVVIGNSQAFSAVDHNQLAERLGAPGTGWTSTLPGLHADGAYAVLKYRIFGAGARPKIVVLPMSLSHLLDVTPPQPHNLAKLQDHIPGSDPVLDAKVFGTAASWPRWNRMVAQVQTARDQLLEQLTSTPLRLAGVADPAARMDAAREAALGKVAGANLAKQVQVMPTGNARPAASTTLAVKAGGLEATLLPDLVALCKAHGAQLVIATVPQQAQFLGASPEDARDVAAWLQAQGVPFLHLEQVPIPPDGWLDPGHISGKGQVVYTDELARRILELGGLPAVAGGSVKLPALPIAPPKPSRSGPLTPPALTETGRSADGCVVRFRANQTPRWRSDAWTSALGLGNASVLVAEVAGAALPGHLTIPEDAGCARRTWHANDVVAVALPDPAAQVAWRWADTPANRRATPREDAPLTQDFWWIPAGTALELAWPEPLRGDRLQLALVELNTAAGVATAQIGGAAPQPLKRWDHVWYADLEIPNAELAAPVTIRTPADGPDLVLQNLAVRSDGSVQLAVGRPGDMAVRLGLAGTVTADSRQPVPATPIPATRKRFQDKLVFEVGAPWSTLTADMLTQAVGDRRFNACIPLAARPEGTPDHAKDRGVNHTRAGAVTAPISADQGDAWELVWRDKRSCNRRFWVFPGEVVTSQPRFPRAVFTATAVLNLDVVPFPAAGEARVRVLTGETVVLDTTIDLAGPRLRRLPLSQAVPAWPEAATLEITAPDGALLSVGAVYLEPADPPADAWFLSLVPEADADDAGAAPPAPSAPQVP